MRYFLVLLLLSLLIAGSTDASFRKRKHRGGPKTEVDLMNGIMNCLRHKDTLSYYYLFPPFDTLWHMVMHNSDHSPEAEKQLANLKEHPQSLIDFDPYYNHNILGRFSTVLAKGEDSGVHWNSIVIQRYELLKDNLTQNLAGYDKIAPERFKGYLFIRDLLGHQTYCITLAELQKIKGYFLGGQVINILQAATIDEFMAKEEKERQYYAWLATHPLIDTPKQDSAKKALADSTQDDADGKKNFLTSGNDDDNSRIRKEVIDRKFYEGKFDEEIPVQLYVRYMKDQRTGKLFTYDGLYKFGDQKNFVRLDISRSAEGKWTMEDDPPVGTLELVLNNKIYTGTWANTEGAGYDVLLKQADIPEKKLEELDNILDKGLSGSVSEESLPEREKTIEEIRKEKEKKMNEDRGNDGN